MRIAQVAPLFESVPPPLYGGTERVVAHLTNELVGLGRLSRWPTTQPGKSQPAPDVNTPRPFRRPADTDESGFLSSDHEERLHPAGRASSITAAGCKAGASRSAEPKGELCSSPFSVLRSQFVFKCGFER